MDGIVDQVYMAQGPGGQGVCNLTVTQIKGRQKGQQHPTSPHVFTGHCPQDTLWGLVLQSGFIVYLKLHQLSRENLDQN